MAKPPKIKVFLVEDWTKHGQGRFFIVGERARQEWEGLSDEAREGLLARAKVQNLLLKQGQSLDGQKLHPIDSKKAPKAKGSIELKLANPMTRGIAFHIGRSDWYLTKCVEGQHPTDSQVTKWGEDCIDLKTQLGL